MGFIVIDTEVDFFEKQISIVFFPFLSLPCCVGFLGKNCLVCLLCFFVGRLIVLDRVSLFTLGCLGISGSPPASASHELKL